MRQDPRQSKTGQSKTGPPDGGSDASASRVGGIVLLAAALVALA